MTIRSFSPFLIPLAALALGSCDSRIAESKSKEKPSAPVVKTINRLATVKSPFLKRHETDPVDWFPWGPEAFEKAVAENKLLMVCVGYSSCPWTLKMQEESYKDPKTASFLNKNYVCVLVDREDRPDINNTYMRYSFLRNQKSGWPLHMWMTPKGLPLHTAIYLPAATGERTPSFFATVEHLQRNWQDDFAYVNREAGLRMEEYQKQLRLLRKGDGTSVLDRPMLDLAYDKLNSAFDPHNGGFSLAPKFHQAPTLEFLLEYSHNKRGETFGRSERALQMVSTTLRHMAHGALQDQIGGGFHRYCQDAAWAVPQFEKMLFDQGVLALIYLKTYQITKDPLCAEVAQRTFDYIESELTHPEGGFYCAENAFSESKSGKGWEREGGFYLWTLAEVQALVSPEIAQVLTQVFGLTESGNLPLEVLNIQQSRFPKFNILRQVKPLEEVAKSLGKPLPEVTKLYQTGCDAMLQARRLRSRPLRDEKVLPSWNGTAISALAEAAGPLKQPKYLARAEKAADYTLKKFLSPENPRPRFAEDYTMLTQSFLDLYNVTGAAKWLTLALDLQTRLDQELWDSQEGGYWDGPEDPNLFMRMKSSDEASEFAPNATAASNLVRLARITGNNQFMQRAAAIFQLVAGRASANPLAAVTASGPATHVRILSAYDQFSRSGLQFIINGPATDPLVQELHGTLLDHYRKHDCILHLNGGDGEAALLKLNPELGKLRPAEGKPGVVVAQNFQAQQTFTTAQELKAFLDATY